jgi:hypothetical protein
MLSRAGDSGMLDENAAGWRRRFEGAGMKLTAAQKHANKVDRIANRLAAMAPQNRINDVAKVFQRLVRMLESDANGNCSCVTCGKVLPWNDSAMNAGHFISRSRHATVFHFINCHPQCGMKSSWWRNSAEKQSTN